MTISGALSESKWVRLVRKLATAQGRDKQQAFVVEGVRAVREAVSCGQMVVVLVDEAMCHQTGIVELVHTSAPVPVISVTTDIFRTLCDTKTPQGVLAVVRDIATSLDALLSRTPALVVVSAGLQDPGNMGTLIRLADAVGAAAFVALRGSVDIYNPKVVRATMGSLFHLPVCHDIDDNLLLNALLQGGYSIVAADAQGATEHFDREFRQPLAVIFGNEGSGLCSPWLEHALLVRIPMPGRAESLNVGVAAGVLLYEVLRQWRQTSPLPPCR
ncbi:MAG: 23S rRNA (uridine(2479)-2'-O)-methyltransferase [Firmicutes bacterium]|nr:23S rRNA (uridine(2479)-2'-O)-methyltransferase [candidate division NPL-UPA2 bacterium]